MSDQLTYPRASDEGFTIAELMTALALMAIVIAGAYMSITAVSAMSDHVFAAAQANNQGSNAIEFVASDVRRAWNPKDGPRYSFRSRTASQCTFYIGGGDDGKVSLVTYKSSADATGGTYALVRTLGTTSTGVRSSDIASNTVFTTTNTKTVGKGLTSGNVFQYFQQAPNLPAATITSPPASVQITVVDKATVGARTAIATNTLLVQVRTLYTYTVQ